MTTTNTTPSTLTVGAFRTLGMPEATCQAAARVMAAAAADAPRVAAEHAAIAARARESAAREVTEAAAREVTELAAMTSVEAWIEAGFETYTREVCEAVAGATGSTPSAVAREFRGYGLRLV